MRWIKDFNLFLFDFDGLLVNTEEIHFLAYQRMVAGRGFHLDWDFNRYCESAHYSAEALEKDLYLKFPDLKAQEPNWAVLYAEKKKAMIDLLNEGAVHLMPGVSDLLLELEKHGVKRCVVTHSPDELVSIVRKKLPVLQTIPHWITRRDYSIPKPHSECYLKAIAQFSNPGDKIIGFEDTPRGIQALLGTKAQPVMICSAKYPEIPEFLKKGVIHYPSLSQFKAD